MKSKSIIVFLAILVLVLAGISYLFSTNTLTKPAKFEREITKIETVSESDETSDIETDLNETDLDNLDFELSNIEAELN
ncbi:hypothetical protein A2130_02920 [Candidatus Woesebacteria bacterium GWC2_33_12]|uniref:Uncharacterized protein n=1 Tax=Candidatus Woesebacteria bacterium GW2011_GWB1_33_22 TaxID=1618566 RepID=A0A0G0C236_9BACT|nr:MAG: hypothetical protein UR29_C0009G0018 [Candidatus Woesebacteria bacterium GW2011_GWC2_33_12]KKP42442.1 MAG: hypothetical protein UR33_C0002G0018 [Candidatus Woesebacteria bacterium GW2011_GWA2_33_20]KKP45185.1 MAG: hypothetical protein UR35_C0002G0018 [Candidatus Woesebacteria bacterium GW2011_GWB1_33_22]KKP46184.1 MAG: hypothetical protein UR37_C0011G0018 [Microgenomates group bacterium GW2011_GWC1_33_28]KKP50854.1 MAG: hypothetical protein UR41_C0002G0018 [Candidatus Woesebacteria bact